MRDWLLENFFHQRYNIVLQQLKNAGLYPEVEAPTFYVNDAYQHGGYISPTDLFSISAAAGSIYYTIDGTDPRLPATSEVTGISLVPENAAKRVLVPTGDISESWKSGDAFNDSTWLSCIGSPGGVGFERTSGYQDFFTLDLIDQMYAKNATCYIRIPFTIDAEYSSLTPREQEILRLLAEGQSAKTIAANLFISPKTVENHRSNILKKLKLHSTYELIRYAAKLGLIDTELWKN